MQPQSRTWLPLIVIVIAIAIGVAGAITSKWFVVVLMVLAILGQVVNLRANGRRSGGGGPG
jgi:UPF0716 family protein affecting phage T7 exclusion